MSDRTDADILLDALGRTASLLRRTAENESRLHAALERIANTGGHVDSAYARRVLDDIAREEAERRGNT